MVRLSPALPYAALYGAIFFTLGTIAPYWPVYLETKAISPGEVGLLLAIAAWVKVAANPLLGHVSDRIGRPRATLAGAAVIAAAAFGAIGMAETFVLILVFQVVAAGTFNPLVPLAESRTMAAVRRGQVDYGRARLWGSITFIIAVLGGGALLDSVAGAGAVLWMILAGLGACAALAFWLPTGREETEAAANAGSYRFLRDPRFLAFLVAGGLLQASHAAYYGFSALHWRASGLDGTTIGWLWSEGVIAEILLFWVAAPAIARLRPLGLLLAASAAGLLRWGVLASTTDVAILAAVQWLHALTFGAAHLGAVHFIAERAAPGLQATAQSLYSALSGGLLMGGAMLAAGGLYEIEPAAAFMAMTGLSVAGGLITGFLLLTGREPKPG